MVNRMLKFFLIVVFACPRVFAGPAGKKIQVVTTLFPTYDFARQIGKDKAEVQLLLPPGIEPHTFEPKPKDVVKINKADVFIYTGKYMEPWVEDLLKGISNKDLLVVDASSGIELLSGADEDHDVAKDSHLGGSGGHDHRDKDPHIWTDFGNAQTMVDTIAEAFVAKDPAGRDFYLSNAREYKSRLADLDRRYQSALAKVRHRTLIYGGHFALGYLAKRYGLKYDSPYEGFSSDAEPSPKAIAQLIDKLKRSGSRYIYYEELLDPKIARAIAQDTGVKMELLHGAHNISKDELRAGVTFIDIMEADLKKLKIGLE